MNNKLNEYLEYLYVTGEMDKLIFRDLVTKYNNTYGELDEDFFNLPLNEQKELLENALKYKVKIIKR